jgi:hypothetical protein
MARLDPHARVYPPGHDGDDAYQAPCEWFTLCTNPANGVADAGPCGHLPICVRCAEHVGMDQFIAGGIQGT